MKVEKQTDYRLRFHGHFRSATSTWTREDCVNFYERLLSWLTEEGAVFQDEVHGVLATPAPQPEGGRPI